MNKSKIILSIFFIGITCMYFTIAAQAQVGIGTATPGGKLHIVHPGPTAHLILEYPGIDNYARMLFTNSGASRSWGIAGKIGFGIASDFLSIYNTGNNVEAIAMTGDGNVGIGVSNPVNKFQIGSVAATGFANNDFALGNGTQAMAILQTHFATLMFSTTDISIMPKNNGNGYLGINVVNPANKLQIGSVGATGFATNDFAIGNGTNAMAIYQTNASTLIGSTTDIILKPRNNGQGRVGINTNTPGAPLEVINYNNYTSTYDYLKLGSVNTGIGRCNGCLAGISIKCERGVMADEFDAVSDARIKDIIGVSNSAKDLLTINALRITDYAFKDKIKYGNKPFKKVIAQEVEKVYPQVVSKHTDFIPNVYQVTSKVEKTVNGYILNFANKHNISKGAKKLRVLFAEGEGMQQYDIVSISSEYQVMIKATNLKTDKAFVYGEEVDDFRTVDYEGLTTLNISATQELSNLVKKQQAIIETQQKQLALMEKRLAALETKLPATMVVSK